MIHLTEKQRIHIYPLGNIKVNSLINVLVSIFNSKGSFH